MKKILFIVASFLCITSRVYSQDIFVKPYSSYDKKFLFTIKAVPLQVEAKSWEASKISVTVLNISTNSQNIGTEVCGMDGVVNWVTNNALVSVMPHACIANIYPPKEIILKPGEFYKQEAVVLFDKVNIESGPFTFKLGLKGMGRSTAWSNDITLDMRGGTQAEKLKWGKSADYQQEFRRLEDVSSRKDGIVKRYYETGELYDERNVKDGKLDGHAKYFYTTGILKKDVFYRNGEPIHWIDYNEDGSVAFDSGSIGFKNF